MLLESLFSFHRTLLRFSSKDRRYLLKVNFDAVNYFSMNPLLNKSFTPATMIGNGKFEPFTVWNDIELKYRITASQWTS